MTPIRMILAALLLGGSLLPAVALAAPEEIQVYMDELGKAGEIGLDVHVNDVLGRWHTGLCWRGNAAAPLAHNTGVFARAGPWL